VSKAKAILLGRIDNDANLPIMVGICAAEENVLKDHRPRELVHGPAHIAIHGKHRLSVGPVLELGRIQRVTMTMGHRVQVDKEIVHLTGVNPRSN